MTITYKVFAAGDTLTANDLLDYIENQVVVQVDNEAELATVHSTYPDVRVAFAEDTDKLYVKDDGVWNPVVAGVSPTLTNLTLTGNLTVQGSTTTIDSTTIAVKDKFVFEGATANDFETTLQVAEPTADRTITLPDATGTVALTSDITAPYALPSQASNSGKFLTTNGTVESWGTVDLTTKTDKSTLTTTGDIYYASGANTPARLGIGSTNNVLRVSSGGIPEWAAPAAGGKVLQVVEGTLTAAFSSSNNAFHDVGLSVSITPSSASSKVLLIATCGSVMKVRSRSDSAVDFKLVRNSTTIKMTRNAGYTGSSTDENNIGSVVLTKLDSPSTTSAITYKVQGRHNNGDYAYTLNNYGTFSGSDDSVSTIIAMEIGA